MPCGSNRNSRSTGSKPRARPARASNSPSHRMFSAGPCPPSHQRITALLDTEPVLEEELEAADEQRDSRHHGIAIAGAEADHQEVDAGLGGHAQRSAMLAAEEEE